MITPQSDTAKSDTAHHPRSTMQSPRVSCLMPVYNGERYLAEALDSVLGQTFTDFELIVVDDGSRDASPAILDDYRRRDPRVRVLTKENGGIVDALNHGLSHAQGDYIARMDADDVCLPNRFEIQVAYLDAHPGCVLVGGLAAMIDERGGPLGTSSGGRHARTRLDVFPPKVAVALHPLVTIRRSALTAVDGYRKMFPHAEDYDLYLRLARLGTIDNPDVVVLKYRKHGQSISQQNITLQERCAALAEIAAIQTHRGLEDPADEAARSIKEVHDRLLARVPDWLFEPYARFRVWRRCITADRAAARAQLPRILGDALSLRPRTLVSVDYATLRLRILGSIAKNLLKRPRSVSVGG